MRILYLPSWYPSADDPVAGVFQRDQALALAALRPDWRIDVSLVSEPALWLTRPRSWPNLLRLGRRATSRHHVEPNLVEWRSSAVVWTELLHDGNRAGVLAAHRANADAAAREGGSFDLVHAHVSYPAGWHAMRLAGELGIPYVITEHMSPFPFPSLLDDRGGLREIVREPLERASATIAVSPAQARELTAYGLPEPRVVPNLVDEAFFTPAPAEPREGTTFFTLGALREQKGIDDLLRAIAVAHAPGARFRIGGTGERAEEYHRLAAELGVEDVVEWLGALDRDAIRDEYRRCDCFVLTSRHESFGIVYAEAMACGKPVIATRSGGPEFIVGEESGLLVDVGDVEGIAAALRRMAQEAGSFDAGAIRRIVENRLSRAAVVDELEGIYALVSS